MKPLKFLLFLLFSITSLFSNEVISLKTRSDVKQNFLLETPKNQAEAIVVLFPGGNGKINLNKEKEDWNTNNFLIKSRGYFLEQNFIVVSIDVPSDRRVKDGMYYNFRTSQEHLQDIRRVLKYLKNNYDKPIWLIGTSRGSESVAFLATEEKSLIKGIVLSSSISKKNSKGKSLQEIPLRKIELPTLLISHKNDACKITPAKGSEEIFNMLSDEIKKEFKQFEGGENKRINPCKSESHHGYLGIEKEVITYISNWIKSN